jgi:hypothetical protein
MSKKYKRQVRKEPTAPTAGSATPTSTSRVQSTGQPVFNPDYTYVIKDLRRIGVLVGSFITILIILSFILR